MALKDLLVHVDHGEAGMMRLRLAADLARRHQARLVALHVREYSMVQQRRLRASELGLVPATEIDAITAAIAREIDDEERPLRELFQQLSNDHGLSAEYRPEYRDVSGHASVLVSQQARVADLAVVGHDLSSAEDMPDDYSFAERILFASGRPLLLVPPRAADIRAADRPITLGRRIALAWNGSRPAARALADAIALIERAEHVTVLTAEANPPDPRVTSSIDAVVEHLRLHAAAVETRTLRVPHRDVADALQSEALAVGADLLVAGAYGHARIWEKMLGGVTRDLLRDLRLPMLMSH